MQQKAAQRNSKILEKMLVIVFTPYRDKGTTEMLSEQLADKCADSYNAAGRHVPLCHYS